MKTGERQDAAANKDLGLRKATLLKTCTVLMLREGMARQNGHTANAPAVAVPLMGIGLLELGQHGLVVACDFLKKDERKEASLLFFVS